MLVMQRELGPGAPFWRVLVVDYRKLVRSDDVETSTVFIAVGQPQNSRCCIHCNTEGYAVWSRVDCYGKCLRRSLGGQRRVWQPLRHSSDCWMHLPIGTFITLQWGGGRRSSTVCNSSRCNIRREEKRDHHIDVVMDVNECSRIGMACCLRASTAVSIT